MLVICACDACGASLVPVNETSVVESWTNGICHVLLPRGRCSPRAPPSPHALYKGLPLSLSRSSKGRLSSTFQPQRPVDPPLFFACTLPSRLRDGHTARPARRPIPLTCADNLPHIAQARPRESNAFTYASPLSPSLCFSIASCTSRARISALANADAWAFDGWCHRTVRSA